MLERLFHRDKRLRAEALALSLDEVLSQPFVHAVMPGRSPARCAALLRNLVSQEGLAKDSTLGEFLTHPKVRGQGVLAFIEHSPGCGRKTANFFDRLLQRFSIEANQRSPTPESTQAHPSLSDAAKKVLSMLR